jgi:hypothetical protein
MLIEAGILLAAYSQYLRQITLIFMWLLSQTRCTAMRLDDAIFACQRAADFNS